MNIHIISNDKFTEKFVWFIDKAYSPKSNVIYIHSNNGENKEIVSDNAKYIERFDEIDFKVLSCRDKLFVHGFYNTKLVRYLLYKKKYYNKNQLVLIIWGADLYNARALLMERGFHIKTRINEIIKKRLIKQCNTFMTFACSDFDLICKWYGAKGKQFDCIYPTNADVKLLDKLLKEKKERDSTKILLGNSATVSNQHMLALDKLSVFSDENIKIICPLSYGDKDYAKEVCRYAKRVFGSKFVPVLEYLTSDEYSKLLNSVDIALFYNNRQQATGNIEILAYLKKKIYLRSDTTTWAHYVVRDDCKFFDALQIDSMSFEDFIGINESDMEYNHNYINKVWDISEIKILWDMVMYT